jgi:hypothetical protein
VGVGCKEGFAFVFGWIFDAKPSSTDIIFPGSHGMEQALVLLSENVSAAIAKSKNPKAS